MKTKDVPALVMLLAGCVYCILGILYKIPLMDFTVQLLIVLLIFWVFGGIVKMVLDRYMGEIVVESEEESEETDGEESDEDAEGEESAESEEGDTEEE